jgi:hypothetical protein
MRKYSGMPELLEQFMKEQRTNEQWVTVQELRDRFGLTRYQCNTVSGFLRRLEFRSFGQFPYIVSRIEHTEGVTPSDPPKCRYLVKRKNCTAGVNLALMHHAGIHGQRKADSGESG